MICEVVASSFKPRDGDVVNADIWEALATYKGWYNNPRRGRFPRVYKPTVWLTPKASYNASFDKMNVRIASVGELPILGYPRLMLSSLLPRTLGN